MKKENVPKKRNTSHGQVRPQFKNQNSEPMPKAKKVLLLKTPSWKKLALEE
jgi:hypothetical protein